MSQKWDQTWSIKKSCFLAGFSSYPSIQEKLKYQICMYVREKRRLMTKRAVPFLPGPLLVMAGPKKDESKRLDLFNIKTIFYLSIFYKKQQKPHKRPFFDFLHIEINSRKKKYVREESSSKSGQNFIRLLGLKPFTVDLHTGGDCFQSYSELPPSRQLKRPGQPEQIQLQHYCTKIFFMSNNKLTLSF